jgi:GNAT superfamily N-acetyltransferase
VSQGVLLEVLEFGRLSEFQRAELEAGEEDPFDAAGNTLQWRPKDRHVALGRPDGTLVASAGLVLGELHGADGPRASFVGIGGVFVTAAYRGQGLGNRIITEALRRAATLGPPLVLLFCHRDRAELYEKHGFAEIDPPVLIRQPDGYVRCPMTAMWRSLGDGVTLPSGQVTVHSLPF